MSEFIAWLSKYLGIEKNPTATIIVSVAVFCLGIIINEVVKALNRFSERRIVREIVRRNYLIFKSYLHEQAKSLREFENFISEKGSPDFNVYILPCSALDNYKDISYNNSFKSFFFGFENIRVCGNLKRIKAFDNLHNALSIIRIEQEKMFPVVARFQIEAAPILNRLNISLKEAFEATTDVYINLHEQPADQELVKWLIERNSLHENYLANVNPSDLIGIKKYFTSVLDFERRNGVPLTKILNAKEFWYYHIKLHTAIDDIDILNTLIKNTKAYCITISKKFEFTAEQLILNYEFLFRRKLKDK